MESKNLSVLIFTILLVYTLPKRLTVAMSLGGIIGNSNIGLGFNGNFKAANLVAKMNSKSSSEEHLETNNLNEQRSTVQESTPEVLDNSNESDVPDTSDEVETTNISEETLSESSESDIDNDSDKLDEDNSLDENATDSNIDDNTISSVVGNSVETSTKLNLDDNIVSIDDAEMNSGYDYVVGKTNGLGEGLSLTNGNDDYQTGNEDYEPVIDFGVPKVMAGPSVLDLGYYYFDSDNYVKNLI